MRRTKIVEITAEGRDRGKLFLLTEMPAMQAEKWAARAFLALAASGTQLPEDAEQSGLAGIAALGFRALGAASFREVEPLMDEMMTCVQVVPDPKRPDFARALVGEDDVEEVATLALLRSEVFELHTGFSLRDALLRSMAARENARISPDTSTFPG